MPNFSSAANLALGAALQFGLSIRETGQFSAWKSFVPLVSSMRVLMYGVTTDICVHCAANALLDRGHHVELVGDAIAALDEKKAAAFVQSFIS